MIGTTTLTTDGSVGRNPQAVFRDFRLLSFPILHAYLAALFFRTAACAPFLDLDR
jgi:hypothetical protein